jgi:Tfp pilus assembly protein PilO
VATINHWWRQIKLLVAVAMLILVAGFAGAQWQSRADSEERATLIARFPIVKEQERAACTREFTAKIDGLELVNKQGGESLAALKAQMQDMHEIVAYTLRYLGDRAKLNDARQAAIIKQAREAATAANAAAQKTDVVEQKVNVATAKAVETAVQPPLPPQPWMGGNRR